MTDLRALARSVFDAGVAAADPYHCVQVHINNVTDRPSQIIAVGKAAVRMAEAGLEAFPDTPTLVVTNYENAKDLAGATVMAAGHPVPDAQSAAAGRAVMAALTSGNGPVLALISGGGSALVPAPAGALNLADKAVVNSVLLGAGIAINEMNLIRQQLSDLKGGGMLRLAAPHPVTGLIISDVIGDDISAIASGPTAAPLGTKSDARTLLKRHGIWDQMPDAVQTHLTSETVDSILPPKNNTLIGSNEMSVTAMRSSSANISALTSAIEGDVADAARQICDGCDLGITVWGGETTVVLRGDGKGGRNQELALRIAIEARKRGWSDWTCLQGGSDGRDGPTDAAGGLIDAGTLDRIAAAGGDLNALLANNDSYAALGLSSDLLMTGATGTNVADLGVMIRT